MRREPLVRADAKRDIQEAKNWYSQISAPLGESFVSSVDQAITIADEHPGAFQRIHKSLRRVLLRRFPYALFYISERSRIVVIGVLHQARDPRTVFRRA